MKTMIKTVYGITLNFQLPQEVEIEVLEESNHGNWVGFRIGVTFLDQHLPALYIGKPIGATTNSIYCYQPGTPSTSEKRIIVNGELQFGTLLPETKYSVTLRLNSEKDDYSISIE